MMQQALTGVFVRTNGWGYHYPTADSWEVSATGYLTVHGERELGRAGATTALAAYSAGSWFSVGWAKDHGEDIGRCRAVTEERKAQSVFGIGQQMQSGN